MWPFKKKKQVNVNPVGETMKDLYQNNLSKDNWKGNKYAERLITEWLTHGKIVLGVDFDDTISPWGFKGFEANVALSKVMNVIALAKSVGCYVSVWSACAPDRHESIANYCAANNIIIDSINENPITLPYGNNRKMYYNWLLDDRSGLDQAVSILEYACYRVKSERKQNNNQNFDI